MTESALLDRAIAAADPARTPRDAEPDAAAREMCERIVRGEIRPRRDHRVAARVTAAAAAVVVAAGVGLAVLLPQGGAEAGTPAPLEFTETGSVHETIAEAQAQLDGTGGPAEPQRVVRTAGWGYSVEVDQKRAEIVPQFSTLTWNPDLSGRMLIIGGEPYDPTDAEAHTSAEVTSTGEVITDLEIEPGQFTTPIPDAPADSADGIRAMLEALGTPASPTADDVLQGIVSANDQWTLTDSQHGYLLDVLGAAEGVTALGESTDRLGRPVVGLGVSREDGAASSVVLVSRDTGRIVGIETTNLVDEGVFPVGAIVSYLLWDVTEEMLE